MKFRPIWGCFGLRKTQILPYIHCLDSFESAADPPRRMLNQNRQLDERLSCSVDGNGRGRVTL
eukprot:2089861-Prorocentrum_lima.AAC.1